MSWIGVDLDGTLAHYDHWRGADHVGEPIEPMLNRVKAWLAEGKDVRIFTARVWYGVPSDYAEWDSFWKRKSEANQARCAIEEWCVKHLGRELKITCEKNMSMWQLWDDRAVQVIHNTGRRADGLP